MNGKTGSVGLDVRVTTFKQVNWHYVSMRSECRCTWFRVQDSDEDPLFAVPDEWLEAR